MTSGVVNNPWQQIGAPSVFGTMPGDSGESVVTTFLQGQAAVANSLMGGAFNKSIMFLGDSLVARGSSGHIPQVDDENAVYYRLTPTYTNINSPTAWIRLTSASVENPTGNGTLRWYAADRAFTWQANGQAEGPKTAIGNDIFLTIPSSVPSARMFLVISRSAGIKATDAQDTVNVTGTLRRVRSTLSTIAGFSTLLLNHVFKTELYYASSGLTASDLWFAQHQWYSKYTDVTVICAGTNDCSSSEEAETGLLSVRNLIQARLAIGSKVVALNLFPYGGLSTTLQGIRHRFRLGLQEICQQLGVTLVDTWQTLASPTSTDGSYRSDISTSDDALHPNSQGSFLAAKYDLVPVLKKLVVSDENYLCPGALYDATLNPNGNLLTNPLFTGTAGNKGNARVTGDAPTSWTVTTSGGTALTVVCTSPQSAVPVPRTDNKPGNWLSLVCDNSTGVNNELAQLYQQSFIAADRFAVGDLLVLEGEFELSGSGINTFNVNGYTTQPVECESTRTLIGIAGETLKARFRSKPVRVETGFSNIQVSISLAFSAGGSGTLLLGPLSFYKLPA